MTDVFSIKTWKYKLPLAESFLQKSYNTEKAFASGKYDTHATFLSYYVLGEELKKIVFLSKKTTDTDLLPTFSQLF